MKILVVSDTHGKLDKVYEVYDKLSNIDLIIHCGDYKKDGEILEDTLGVKTVSVKGNCDGSRGEDWEIVETPYGNIFVTHGSLEGVNYDLTNLMYKATEKDCIAACFGHTHVPMFEEFNGLYMINPGSLSQPRDGSGGSYAILHSTEEDFYGSIVYYDTVCGKNKKNKAKGGFLRDMLNYSDRF